MLIDIQVLEIRESLVPPSSGQDMKSTVMRNTRNSKFVGLRVCFSALCLNQFCQNVISILEFVNVLNF